MTRIRNRRWHCRGRFFRAGWFNEICTTWCSALRYSYNWGLPPESGRPLASLQPPRSKPRFVAWVARSISAQHVHLVHLHHLIVPQPSAPICSSKSPLYSQPAGPWLALPEPTMASLASPRTGRSDVPFGLWPSLRLHGRGEACLRSSLLLLSGRRKG